MKKLLLLSVILSAVLAQAQLVTSTTFGHGEANTVTRGLPHTTRTYGTYLICGGQTHSVTWPTLEPSAPVAGVHSYVWTNLDDTMTAVLAVPTVTNVIFCPWKTPSWANPVGCAGAYSAGCAANGQEKYPPDNIADWTAFITAIRDRYDGAHGHGRIKILEIWNEPNTFWEDKSATNTPMDDLAQLALAAYPVWTTISGNKVLGPSPQGVSLANANGYLFKYFTRAQLVCTSPPVGNNTCMDIVGFHGYVGTHLDDSDDEILAMVSQIKADMLSKGINTLPLWDSENSWAKDSLYPNRELEASWLKHNVAELAAGVAVTVHFLWSNEHNPIDTVNDYGGMWIREAGPTCISGIAWEQIYDWLVGSTLGGAPTLSNHVYTVNLTRPNGTAAQIVWRDSTNTACSGAACACTGSSGICTNGGTCTKATFTAGAQFTHWFDLGGGFGNINSTGAVQVGLKMVLLTSDPVSNVVDWSGQAVVSGRALF